MKDYNELLIMCKYVVYDINNSDLKSFYNDRFEVVVYNEESEVIEYEVVIKRDSIFNIKQLKTIKYNGLVG